MHNHCQIEQREIMPKVRKADLSFLYTTRHLVLFYISTKYHQNIPKDIQVIQSGHKIYFKRNREIIPKVRKSELSFLYMTCGLVLFYISTKYHQNIPKGIQGTEGTRSLKPTPTGSIPKTICPPTLWWGGGGGDLYNNLYRQCTGM